MTDIEGSLPIAELTLDIFKSEEDMSEAPASAKKHPLRNKTLRISS